MGTISSGVGLVSGLNSGQIIDQLISLDARPAKDLQTRIDQNNRIKTAYQSLQAGLVAIKGSADQLIRPSTFQNATATSSNTNVLSATATPSSPAGIYQFTVARTVTSQSLITGGFADATSAAVGAGQIQIGLGGGEVTSSPNLSDLNGGAGVRRGVFRITDRSGSSTSIDIGNALTLDDVIKKINTADNIQIKASAGPNGLVLQDLSGGTGNLRVDDLQGGSAATDLGIRGAGSGDTLTGSTINRIGRGSLLSSLNDGLGVRTTPGSDFSITTADGTVKQISLLGKRTVGDVIDSLNQAGGGKFTASLRSDGKGLQVVDNTTGSGELTLSALSGSKALRDLGLAGAASGNTLTGGNLVANLGSVLLKNLSGGAGITGGQITITDRNGTSANLDLSGAQSLDDVLSAINGAGTTLRASVSKSGTRIELTDTSGGTGNVVVSDTSGTLAQQLGIAGTFDTNKTVVSGTALKRQYVNENSLLADLNGGKGVTPGVFRITNGRGTTADVDLRTLSNGKLSDVISAINAKGIGVTASVNSDGSGLLLTDTTTGSSSLKVEDLSGSLARDLNIAKTAAAGSKTINGAFGATIDVTATDTLNTVLTKINSAGVGVVASVVNDGSGATPFRLTLTALNSGRDGRFTFDAGKTGLGADTLVRAQDAAVFLGGTGSTNPVLITSSSNTLSNVVPGLSITLAGVSDQPVTVSVAQNADSAVSQLQGFVKSFNSLTQNIADLTKFDTNTQKGGLLLGDATAQSINDSLFQAINTSVSGAGKYSLLAQVGVTISADNQLNFDETKFRNAYASDATSVQRLFTAFRTETTTTYTKGGATVTPTGTVSGTVSTPFGTELAGTTSTNDGSGNTVTRVTKVVGFGIASAFQKALSRLNDPVNGTLTISNKSIDTANDLYNKRISSINDLLVAKRSRLQQQFANLETVLATLQGQQSAIGRIQSVSAPASSSSSK